MQSHNLWVLLALCTLATFAWRAAGTAIARRLDPDGPLFQWFNCVAYAMLAGLIVRIIALPVGALAETPAVDRILAMAVGFVLFVTFKRNIFAATGAAFLIFLALTAWRTAGGA